MTAESIKTVLFTLLFGLSLWLSYQSISQLKHIQQQEQDLAHLKDIKYGLLNSENWLAQISAIIERRVTQFELNEQNRSEIKRVIQISLNRLILEIDERLRKDRERGDFWDRLTGSFEQALQDSLIDLDKLRRDLPYYTDQILDELDKPQSRREIKKLLTHYLADFNQATFNKVDTSYRDRILAKYHCDELTLCQNRLQKTIEQAQKHNPVYVWLSVFVVMGLIISSLLDKAAPSNFRLVLLIFSTALLLIGGISTPMIEIEAKISNLDIQFFGESLHFSEQILFYQTKSILDVIRVLFENGDFGMVFVAFLIGLFSVIFPIGKLLSTFIYFRNWLHWRNHWLIEFLALKSGKWSMADVMVIAIFMACIGLNGIIENQLANLAETGKNVQVFTTNGTALQSGFYLFLFFTLASLLLSSSIQRSVELENNAASGATHSTQKTATFDYSVWLLLTVFVASLVACGIQ